MKLFRHVAAAALLVLAGSRASAQLAQTQTVPLSVGAIDKLAVTGLSPLTITISTLAAPTTELTTTYSITTNSDVARKITAQLDEDLPAGVTLSVAFESPGGGAVPASRNLTATPQDVVTNISHVVASLKTITYLVTVAPTVMPGSITRTVTYTFQ